MICDAYAENDTRIKVIHKQNGGLVSARQAGVEFATGEYCICVDGDDWIEKDYLENAQKIIMEFSPEIIFFGYFSGYDNEHKHACISEEKGFCDKNSIKEKIFPKLIQGKRADYIAPHLWAKVFKRSLYADIQMSVNPEIKIGEDGACTIPCIYNASSVFFSDICVYNYRTNNNSMTRNRKPFDWNGPKLIAKQIEKELDISAFDFKEQLYRKTVHELFSVAVSQFNRKEECRKIKKDIKTQIATEPYATAIKKAKFRGIKARLMHFALKHRVLWLLKLQNKRN